MIVHPLGADRLTDIFELDLWAFPSSRTATEMAKRPHALDFDRSYGIEDPTRPGRLAAFHLSYPFAATPVPGGSLDVAGLSWVGVHPQFRRQGLLRTMMTAHFAHCQERGEAVSLLFAAEPAIYGRFGYGMAAQQVTCTVPRGAAMKPINCDGLSVALDQADHATHVASLARLAASQERPGQVRRTDAQWLSLLTDRPDERDEYETLRVMFARRDGVDVGYALFQRKFTWSAAGNQGSVAVHEFVAEEPAVAALLWRHLLDFDLTTEVHTPPLALDDPLLNLLVDVRATLPRLQDNVWARLVDLPTALTARRYAREIDVILDVTDTALPVNAGRWRLRTAGPTVERTDAAPDLSVDVRELGAAYLGGVSLDAVSRAGLVTEHTPGTLTALAQAFAWQRAPLASWIF